MSEGVDREVESSGEAEGWGGRPGVASPLGASGHGSQNGQPLGPLLQRLALSLLTPEELIDSLGGLELIFTMPGTKTH